MKDWIKIETSLMSDPRINRLCNDLGAKGLGIYLLMRVLTDENVKGCKLSTLLDGASYITSRRIAVRVIMDYDLFDKIGGGLYRACPLFNPYKGESEALRASERTDERERERADKPINELELELEENTLKESGSVDDLKQKEEELSDEEKNFIARMHQEYPNISRMKQPLTYGEMLRLLRDYPRELVLSVLNDMENRPTIAKNYLSANRTCRSWINSRRR